MAVENIKKAFDRHSGQLWQHLSGGVGRRAAGKRFAHTIRVHEKAFVQKTVDALNGIAVRMGADELATYSNVKAAFDTVAARWATNTGRTDITARISGGVLFIRKESNVAHWSEGRVNRKFREQIHVAWRKNLPRPQDAPQPTDKVPRTAGRDVLTTTGYGQEGEFEGTGFSHDRGQVLPSPYGGIKMQQSNVANAAFLEWMERQRPGQNPEMDMPLGDEIVTVDIATWVMEKLEVGWKQTQNPDTGVMEWVVTGDLGGENPPPGDEDLTQEWENTLLKKFEDLLVSDEEFLLDPDFRASEPFTHKIATKEMRRIADEYLKERGFTKGGQKIKVKGLPKKPKKSARHGTILPKKRGKSISKKALQRAPAGGATVDGKVYKGGQFLPGNEQGVRFVSDGGAGASVALELVRLKKIINSNLSAEVTRNMGRPALRWQTGRFANSVKLLSLQFAQNTVMAKYTYMLKPYETFENTGKRRWPMSYNPKTLIAKSIRNLAQGRI